MMKALIRNKGETVTEISGLTFINWTTGAPLTNEGWSGGAYVLVENYDPNVCEVVDPVEFEISARGSGVEHYNEETVTIDGKEYTRAELLEILNKS